MNTRTRGVSLVSALLVVAGVSLSASAWAGPQRHDRGAEPTRHESPSHGQSQHKKYGVRGHGPERGIHGSRGPGYGYGRHHGHDRGRGHGRGHDYGRHHGKHHGYAPPHYGRPACRDHRHRHWGHHYHDHYGQPYFFFGLRTDNGGLVIYR